MSTRTHLITLAEVKDLTGLNANVDDRKLKSGRDRAHLQCKERLGSTRYDALVAAYLLDNTLAGASNEKWRNLKEAGKGELDNYLAWLSYYLSIPALHGEADKAGIFKKEGQEFKPLDKSERAELTTNAKDAYQLYERAMLQWIDDNEDDDDLPDVETPTESDQPQFVTGIVTQASTWADLSDETPNATFIE